MSTTFVPTVASASTINTEIASNPAATIAEIEKIGLPMSDEMAGEVRGEGWLPSWVVPVSTKAFAIAGAVDLYWKLLILAYGASYSATGWAYDQIGGVGVVCYRSATANSTAVYCN